MDTPSKRRGCCVTREQMKLPHAHSTREGELYVWCLCSCTSLAFERRFLEILERTDHFYAWQLGDWLRLALARLQTDQLASQSCTDDGFHGPAISPLRISDRCLGGSRQSQA